MTNPVQHRVQNLQRHSFLVILGHINKIECVSKVGAS